MHRSNPLHSQSVGSAVNRYCFEMLEELRIDDANEGVFDEMKKPFNNIKKLYFDGDLQNNSID